MMWQLTFRFRLMHLWQAFAILRFLYSIFSASVIFRRMRCLGCSEVDTLKTLVIWSRAAGLDSVEVEIQG